MRNASSATAMTRTKARTSAGLGNASVSLGLARWCGRWRRSLEPHIQEHVGEQLLRVAHGERVAAEFDLRRSLPRLQYDARDPRLPLGLGDQLGHSDELREQLRHPISRTGVLHSEDRPPDGPMLAKALAASAARERLSGTMSGFPPLVYRSIAPAESSR